LIPDPGNPLDFNRYGYARYNPLKYTDPTGHYVDDGCQIVGCEMPKDPLLLPDDDPQSSVFDTDLGGNNELESRHGGDELTPTQIAGKVGTTLLVEVAIVMPAELVLITGSIAAPELGPAGILLELVLVPTEIVVADFGISLLINTNKSVKRGHSVDFEWTLIPKIVSTLPESIQENLHDLIPGVVP